jgi:CTP synthase
LFVAFIGASVEYNNGERLPVEMPAVPDHETHDVEHTREDASVRG